MSLVESFEPRTMPVAAVPATALHTGAPPRAPRDLFALPPAEMREEAERRLRVEAAQTPEARRRAVYARVTGWLTLDGEDARVAARAYDEALRALTPEERERVLEAERHVVLHGLAFRDFQRLAEIVPWLRSEFGVDFLREAVEPDLALAS